MVVAFGDYEGAGFLAWESRWGQGSLDEMRFSSGFFMA